MVLLLVDKLAGKRRNCLVIFVETRALTGFSSLFKWKCLASYHLLHQNKDEKKRKRRDDHHRFDAILNWLARVEPAEASNCRD